MYVIREVFQAKPGQAGRMAKMFKKMPMGNMKQRVLTDMVGPYNTVIMETEVEKLADWEKMMNDMKSGKPDPQMEKMDAKTKEEMSHYHEMFTSGRREIYQVMD